MSVEVLLLIIAITVVVIALFLVPTLIQMKATAQRVERLVEETEREVFPMFRQLRDTAENVNRISSDAQKGLEHAEPLLEALNDIGQFVHRFTSSARGDLGQYAGNALGLWLGLRAASKVVLKDIHKHKGGE